MKRTVFILLCCLFPLMAMAQATRPVRGVVFDAQGTPMAGATLTAVGSNDSATSGVDGTFDMMVSPYTKYIEASKEGYLSIRSEVDGSYLVFKLAVDKKYLENKAKAEEAARVAAEEKAKAEEEARLAEERRIAAEKAAAEKAERERVAAEERKRLEEERRIAAEKAAAEKAEQARIAAEKAAAEKARLAEEKRIAAEKAAAEKAEKARLAAEEKARQAEEKRRLEEERRIAAEKAAAEKAEQARLAAEMQKQLEEQTRLANAEQARNMAAQEAAKKAEEERRIAAEKARQAEEARIAAEKAAAEKQKKMEARQAYVKEWKSAEVKGYRSQVEALWSIDFDLTPSYSLHYIGGYQINNYLYVGAGVGLLLHSSAFSTEWYQCRWSKTGNGSPYIALNFVNYPVFGYFRANFANRRLAPFFALAAGYRFGAKHVFEMPWDRTAYYPTGGVFINPQVGLNFRMTKKADVYIAGGFNIMQMPQFDHSASTMFDAKFYNKFYRGFDLRLGFTF